MLTDHTSGLSSRGLLELLQWHITRAESQRNGFWTRAAASLSANTLIIAGSAFIVPYSAEIELAAGGRHPGGLTLVQYALIVAAMAAVSSIVAVFFTLRSFGVIAGWPTKVLKATQDRHREGLLYSLPAAVDNEESYEQFEPLIKQRSIDEEIAGATLELWRLSGLHRHRINALITSSRLTFLGGMLLVAALVIIVIATLR